MPLFEPSIQTISAGTTWATGRGISFGNANGVSFGLLGNTVTASFNAGTAAGGVDIAAGTQTVTSGTVVFSNSNNISFGLNGSVLTATVNAVVAKSVSLFSQWGGFETNYYLSNAQISFQKVSLPMAISASTGAILAAITGHSNSSGGITISMGVYSINGQTAASLSSASTAITWVSSQYSSISGTRYREFDFQSSLPIGDYLFAFAISTTNDGTMRIFGRHGVNIVGSFAGMETLNFIDGISVSTITGLPSSVVATNTGYVRTGVSARQQPGFLLIGTF